MYYRSTGFPATTCIGQIAAALYWGPTHVTQAIERCKQLLADESLGQFGRAAAVPYLGGLHAQAGRLSEARELVAEAEHTYEELGSPTAVIHCGTVRADLEFLAADFVAAEETLREQCEYLELIADRAHLAVRAAKLADAIYRQGRLDEAQLWAVVSRSNAATDDQSAQLVLGAVESKLLARRGAVTEALEYAEEIVRLAESTDGLNLVAATKLALAEVLRIAQLHAEAQRSIEDAIALFERKGNSVAALQARELLDIVPA